MVGSTHYIRVKYHHNTGNVFDLVELVSDDLRGTSRSRAGSQEIDHAVLRVVRLQTSPGLEIGYNIVNLTALHHASTFGPASAVSTPQIARTVRFSFQHFSRSIKSTFRCT